MPKRMLLIALAMVSTSLAFAACGDTYNPNDLYGSPVPTASPTPSETPNAKLTAAPITVTVNGEPIANQPVSLYTSVSSNGTVGGPGSRGTLITTQDTGSAGTTTFSSLTPGTSLTTGFYCFSSQYTPLASGSTQQTDTICTNLWGFGITIAF